MYTGILFRPDDLNVFMPYVAFELNEVLNLLCMRNGKLIGPTHCDATMPTVCNCNCNTGMPVRLTEMKSNSDVNKTFLSRPRPRLFS